MSVIPVIFSDGSGTLLWPLSGKKSAKQLLTENTSVYIPIGSTHRNSNPSTLALEYFDIRGGGCLLEHRSMRLDDDLGRSQLL